jgi:thiol-disulfide isomerase/thioredoxin
MFRRFYRSVLIVGLALSFSESLALPVRAADGNQPAATHAAESNTSDGTGSGGKSQHGTGARTKAASGAVKKNARTHAAASKPAAGPERLLPWHDVKSGFALAKRNKKLILVDFYTDWCGWCKVMDENTYTDPQVIKLLKARFVLIKADAQDGGAGQELAKHLSISGFPSTCFIEPKGTVRGIAVGFRDPEQMLIMLNQILLGKPLPSDEQQ